MTRAFQQPITDLRDNLAWTRHGVVWATWRISGRPYGARPLKEKRSVKDLHRLLVRALGGEALALGLTVSIDPTTVVQRLIDGVDLEDCPLLIEEARANLDRLDEIPLGERLYYLSVPLPNAGAKRWKEPLRAVRTTMEDTLRLPRSRVSEQDVQLRLQQAAQVMDSIPAPFEPAPVTPAEHLWIAAHHQQRGWVDIPPQQRLEPSSEPAPLVPGQALPEPVLDMGAWSDLDATAVQRANPAKRRVLKVTNPVLPTDEQFDSYQALMVLAAPPSGGVTWPGSELLARLDELGPEIDWALRLRIRNRDEAMKANRKVVRELRDQYHQRDSDAGEELGSHDLDLVADLVAEYQGLLATDRLEVEVEHTLILAVGAATFAEANAQGDSLLRTLGSYDFSFERPIGEDIELWKAMHIGVPGSRVVRRYAQITTSHQFAALVPFTSSRLGGSRGQIAGLNRSTARTSVVHQDLNGYPALNKSGSIVWVGELGSGKSFAMKTAAAHVVANAGQLFVIDKSNEGEWATFLETLLPEQDRAIVDPQQPCWSMDPLRLLPDADHAAAAARRFFGTLLHVSSVRGDPAALTLATVFSPTYLLEHELRSSADVLAHLKDGCDLPGAQNLAVRMTTHAEGPFARLVFDPDLPVPDGSQLSAVVWRTNTMSQLTGDELLREHLFEALGPERLFARAWYQLMTYAARTWIFANRSRFGVLVADEAYDIFGNPESARDGETVVREGRRANGALYAGSHDPDSDFGTDTMRRLMPTRYVMRHTDPKLAAASIRFLGIPDDDPDFELRVDELINDTAPEQADRGVVPGREGECWMRDAYGGIGPVKILGPAQPHLLAAVKSTPPSTRREVPL